MMLLHHAPKVGRQSENQKSGTISIHEPRSGLGRTRAHHTMKILTVAMTQCFRIEIVLTYLIRSFLSLNISHTMMCQERAAIKVVP